MIFGYLCAIGIAVVFMLYMDGEIGVMMLSFLLLMPLLSVLATFYVRNKLHVTLLLPDTGGKHRPCTAVIRLEKDTPLPLPFLRLEFFADAHFEPLNPKADPLPEKPDESALGALRYQIAYRRWKQARRTQLTPETLPLCLSMSTARRAEYRIPLNPRFCGSGALALQNLALSDYFALFSFRIQTDIRQQMLITPEIPALKTNSTLFRSVSTAVAAADEESEATPTHSASAMPGYEHRDYIAGDSLKRINWKLSSKRHHLMVRQDEPIALARLSVVLDFRRDARNVPLAERLEIEEQLIETALGFLMLCARYGYPCKLSFADSSGSWSTISVDDGEQLAIAAVDLLSGGFRPEADLAGIPLVPPDLMQESAGVLLYFTTHTGAETAASLEKHPTLLYLVIPEQLGAEAVSPKNGSLWFVTPDHRLLQAGGES